MRWWNNNKSFRLLFEFGDDIWRNEHNIHFYSFYSLPGESSLPQNFTNKNSFSYLEWYGHKNYLKNTLHTNFKKSCAQYEYCVPKNAVIYENVDIKFPWTFLKGVYEWSDTTKLFYKKKSNKNDSLQFTSYHSTFLNDCFV